MATKYLTHDIKYWPEHHDDGRLERTIDIRVGAAFEVEGDPIPMVPGEGHFPHWGSKGGHLVATEHGHRIIVPADLLSDRPPCKDCLEVQDGIDESGVCPGCREWAAMTPEQRAACFA